MMRIGKIQIPGSSFFWGIITGIIIMVFVMMYVFSGYKFMMYSYQSYKLGHSKDSFSFDDTQQAMEDLYRTIKSQYYKSEDVDETKMARQALTSFVNGLGDPFTSYLPPIESQELYDNISGDESIEGIGAILSQTEQGIVIEEVVHSSPAAQVGLRPLDVIMKVNGSGVQNQSLNEVVQSIRGPKGTTVDLTLVRVMENGTPEVIEQTLIRDTVLIPSVTSKIITTGDINIGYIGLSVFAADTDRRLKKEIETLLDQKIQGVILDLRGNGGGLLPESVSIASHFLPKGSIVTKAVYRIYSDDTYKAIGDDSLSTYPLVILVNGYSASASEIITLALRENRCSASTELSRSEFGSGSQFSSDCTTLVVGSRTFGKGTIQSLQNMQFGGSLKLTVGQWFSPSGLSVHEVGILPDVVIPFDPISYYSGGNDVQLNMAESLLSQYLQENR